MQKNKKSKKNILFGIMGLLSANYVIVLGVTKLPEFTAYPIHKAIFTLGSLSFAVLLAVFSLLCFFPSLRDDLR